MRTRKLKLAGFSRVAVRIDGTKITRPYIKRLRGSPIAPQRQRG